MKTCHKCHRELPLVEFGKDSQKKEGISSRCRQCSSEYSSAWYQANKERRLLKAKAWSQGNRDRHREAQRAWAKRNRPKQHAKNIRKYGIDAATYASLLEKQGGVCAICSGTNANGRRLAVDHEHDTGTIRGLLCGNCNVGLGHFFDSEEMLGGAISYLKAHKPART